MTDEAQNSTPVQLVPSVATIKAILGNIQVGDTKHQGAPNNTRWVLDIDAVSGEAVEIHFLDYMGGAEISPDLMSFSIAPASSEAWDAKPFGVHKLGTLTLHSKRVVAQDKPMRFQCRVSVDVMHTATR